MEVEKERRKWKRNSEEMRRTEKVRRRKENEEKITNLDTILERIREENRVRKIRMEERRLEEEKRKAGEMKRMEVKKMEAEKRRDRIKKKRVMEERWELIRWITNYIDTNKEKWEREKLKRDQERRARLEEWDKSERFRKIATIRERMRDERKNPTEEMKRETCWKSWRKGKDQVDENELTAGWKQQVGDEDLHHPAGSEESKIVGPTPIGAARPGPTGLGQEEVVVQVGWKSKKREKDEENNQR